jgi:hypothetical protein
MKKLLFSIFCLTVLVFSGCDGIIKPYIANHIEIPSVSMINNYKYYTTTGGQSGTSVTEHTITLILNITLEQYCGNSLIKSISTTVLKPYYGSSVAENKNIDLDVTFEKGFPLTDAYVIIKAGTAQKKITAADFNKNFEFYWDVPVHGPDSSGMPITYPIGTLKATIKIVASML